MSRRRGAIILGEIYLAVFALLVALMFRGITWEITAFKAIALSLGCLAFTIFCLQFVLSARLKLLDWLVPQNQLLVLHGVMAGVGLLVAFAHGVMVAWGDEGSHSALAEAGEIARLLFLLTIIGGVLLLGTTMLEHVPGYTRLRRWIRSTLRLRYHWCVWAHNFALVAACAMVVHILLLSAPTLVPFKVAGVTLFTICVGLHVYNRLIRARVLPLWECTYADDAAPDVRVLRFSGSEGQRLFHRAGQFAYLSLRSAGLREPHPITISADRDGEVEFDIKAVGDWTRRLAKVEVGHEALIHGPFGAFTAAEAQADAPLILLAGGIGVTPLLAMLRDLASRSAKREVVLVWSVRNEADAFARAELDELGKQLPNLRSIIRVTQGDAAEGRLDQAALGEILGEVVSRGEAFVCGPPPFLDAMASALRGLGLPKGHLHMERFAY
jgi:predicted ferric reductase